MTIKFVRIGAQIEDGKDQFCFFDTAGIRAGLPEPMHWLGKIIFNSWDDFVLSYNGTKKTELGFEIESVERWYKDHPLSFFKSLMPPEMLPENKNKFKCDICGKLCDESERYFLPLKIGDERNRTPTGSCYKCASLRSSESVPKKDKFSGIELKSSSDWISIEDQKPPLGKNVLILNYDNCIEIKYLVESESILVGDRSKSKKYSFYPGGNPIENVTHWMGLPALPKEEIRCSGCDQVIKGIGIYDKDFPRKIYCSDGCMNYYKSLPKNSIENKLQAIQKEISLHRNTVHEGIESRLYKLKSSAIEKQSIRPSDEIHQITSAKTNYPFPVNFTEMAILEWLDKKFYEEKK